MDKNINNVYYNFDYTGRIMNMEHSEQNISRRKKVELYELFTVVNINSFCSGGLPRYELYQKNLSLMTSGNFTM